MHDQRGIVEELALLKNDYSFNVSTQEERFQRFQKISVHLSSQLPPLSDSSLLAIDHLLSTDEKFVSAKTNKHSEFVKSLTEKSFPLYNYIYYETMLNSTLTMDATYLQLIEKVSTKTFKECCSYLRSIPKVVTILLAQRDAFKLIRAIKILKVSLDNHTGMVLHEIKDSQSYHIFTFYWLSELSKLPKARYSYEQPILTWLSEQSTSIFKKIRIKNIALKLYFSALSSYFEGHHFSKKISDPTLFIKQLAKCFKKMRVTVLTFYFNHLYDYFMSVVHETYSECEKKNATKTKLNDFFIGLYMVKYDLSYDKSLQKINQYHYLELGENTEYIINHFMYLMADIVRAIQYLPNSDLRQLEAYCTYDISYYVPKGDSCKSYLNFLHKVNELMDKYFQKSKHSEDRKTEGFLFEVKKFCFFDDFMKALHVMDIIHYAWLSTEDRYEQAEPLDQNILSVFRPPSSPIKTYINEALLNPSKRGRVNWWIQVILRKCPFLIMSHHHESHAETLIRVLKGKRIGKSAEEDLHFVINSNVYQEKGEEVIFPYDQTTFHNERNDFTDDETEFEDDNFNDSDDDSDNEISRSH